MDLDSLAELRDACNTAIRTKRSLDKLYGGYINSADSVGFSGARTASYNARAADKSNFWRHESEQVVELCRSISELK